MLGCQTPSNTVSHLAFVVPAAGASAVVATDDEEVLSKSCKEVAKAGTDFVWTQLRSLGTFLGSRAAQKQQQQRSQTVLQQQASPEQQAQPMVQPLSDAAASPAQSLAAVSNGVHPAGLQAKDHTDANFTSDDTTNRCDAPSQNGTVKEEAASTTHEHTESHKYVTTERDASGSQQATAEVVQKNTTTQVHKRKREETSANGENGHKRRKEETSASGSDGTEVDPSQSEAGPMEGPSQQPGPTAQDLTADCPGAGAQNCRHSSPVSCCACLAATWLPRWSSCDISRQRQSSGA